MIVVSAGHVGATRGSGIVSSTADVLEMSVVRVIIGVVGVCVMCLLGARRRRGGMEERIVFGLYQLCGNSGSVGRVSLFGLRWCGWCRWGVGRGLGPGFGGVGWYYVCVSCECGFFCVDGRSSYPYIVLGGYMHILGAHSSRIFNLT